MTWHLATPTALPHLTSPLNQPHYFMPPRNQPHDIIPHLMTAHHEKPGAHTKFVLGIALVVRPCAHSISKFFLWLTVFSLLKFPPLGLSRHYWYLWYREIAPLFDWAFRQTSSVRPMKSSGSSGLRQSEYVACVSAWSSKHVTCAWIIDWRGEARKSRIKHCTLIAIAVCLAIMILSGWHTAFVQTAGWRSCRSLRWWDKCVSCSSCHDAFVTPQRFTYTNPGKRLN